MLSAARAHQEGQRRLSRKPLFHTADVVVMRNDTAGDVDRFGVLGIGEPLINPQHDLAHANQEGFQSQVAVTGLSPGEGHRGKFGILLEPVARESIGRACVIGATVARVRMDDEDHGFADIDEGDPRWLLSTTEGMAELLWVQPKSQREDPDQVIAWAIVRLGGVGGGSVGSTPVILREIDADNIVLKVQRVSKKQPADPEEDWDWERDGFEASGELLNARPEPYCRINYYESLIVVGTPGHQTKVLEMVEWLGMRVVLQSFKIIPMARPSGPYAQSEGAPHTGG